MTEEPKIETAGTAGAAAAPAVELDDGALDRVLDRYIALIAVLAALSVALVVLVEFGRNHDGVDWIVFGVISALLVITECRTTIWLRFGNGGVVTPSWAFSFALMLLGTPTGAIAAMAIATTAAEITARKDFRKIVFNTAQVSLSLAVGGLVLFAAGIEGPLFDGRTMPFTWGAAMILSGTLVFVTNGIVICYLLSLLEGKRFVMMMREGFALTMSADAAMLALAPILVISLQYSMLMLPLIGTATFLVYQTARQALQRAHEANHDALTHVLNRRAFNNELSDFTSQPAPVEGAVLILDLDRFKEINDRLGHQTGDAVLRAFAQRIVSSLPPSAVVARLGGDEFAILLPDSAPNVCRAITERLHRSLAEPLIVDGFPLSTGTSIGVAVSPEHGNSPSELLHAADIAMYRAKRYRSCVEFYEQFGTTREHGRITLLGDLSAAIENDEIVVEYQPQVDVVSGAITAVESLIRWEHPSLGRIQPIDFVKLAEQTDLIGPLTNLVIRRAIADVSELGDDIVVAVNVSARNLEDRHFASEVVALLDESGFPPHRLELEITESAIAQEPERTAVAIDALRSHGVRVSIDDFGTGYSSFATLRDVAVDRIKVDRSFISGMATNDRDRRIVGAIIDLAHDLGLAVVAEGVEKEPTLAALRDAGCDVAQGFLFSRPVPPSELRLGEIRAEVPRMGDPAEPTTRSLADVVLAEARLGTRVAPARLAAS